MFDCAYGRGVTVRPVTQYWNEVIAKQASWIMEYPPLIPELLSYYIGTSFNRKKVERLREDCGVWTREPGLMCSEFIALCDGGNISRFSGREPHRVRSVEFQLWADAHRIDVRRIGGVQ